MRSLDCLLSEDLPVFYRFAEDKASLNLSEKWHLLLTTLNLKDESSYKDSTKIINRIEISSWHSYSKVSICSNTFYTELM